MNVSYLLRVAGSVEDTFADSEAFFTLVTLRKGTSNKEWDDYLVWAILVAGVVSDRRTLSQTTPAAHKVRSLLCKAITQVMQPFARTVVSIPCCR